MDKNGYATSEFWLTLVSQLIPIFVLLGFLSPSESAQVQDDVSKVIVLGFTFAQQVITLVMYIYSRIQVKKSAMVSKK